MISQLELHSRTTRHILDEYNITLLVLFGSQVTGHTHPKSDTDIAFLSSRRLSPSESAGLCFALSQELKIKDLECMDLQMAPAPVLQQVALHGRLLYEREPHAYAQFRIYGLKRAMEAGPLLRLREDSLKLFLQSI